MGEQPGSQPVGAEVTVRGKHDLGHKVKGLAGCDLRQDELLEYPSVYVLEIRVSVGEYAEKNQIRVLELERMIADQ